MRMILGGAAVALWLGIGACNRGGGARGSEEHQAPQTSLTRGAAVSRGPGVRPGIYPQAVLGAVRNPYAGDHAAIVAGRQLFTGYNCAGCHAPYAGGGMGPSLRDSFWIYGSGDAQIFSSIAEGRPNGMPAWGGHLSDDVIWRLVAYIKTLGTAAEPVKPPVPSRNEARESAGGRDSAG